MTAYILQELLALYLILINCIYIRNTDRRNIKKQWNLSLMCKESARKTVKAKIEISLIKKWDSGTGVSLWEFHETYKSNLFTEHHWATGS